MRKLPLVALSALALLLSVGCGGDDEAEPLPPAGDTTSTPPPQPEAPVALETAPAPGPAAPAAPGNATTPPLAAPMAEVRPGTQPMPPGGAATAGAPAPKLELIETKYIPQDAVGVLVIHPQMILESELLDGLIAEEQLTSIQQTLKIDPRSIQRVTAVFWPGKEMAETEAPEGDTSATGVPGGLRFVAFQNEDAPSEDSPFPPPAEEPLGPGGLSGGPPTLDLAQNAKGGFIVRLSEPLDVTQIEQTFEGEPITWTESEIDGKTVHLAQAGDVAYAVYQPDPQTVIAAETEDELKLMLTATKGGPVGRLLSRAELSHALTTVFNIKAAREQVGESAAAASEHIDKLETAILYADLPSNVRLAIVLEAIDEATPKQMLADLEMAMQAARQQLPQMAQQMGPFGPQLVQMAEQLLDTTQLEAKGKVFTVTVNVPKETILAVTQLIGPFIQGMMMQPGGEPPFPEPPANPENGQPDEGTPPSFPQELNLDDSESPKPEPAETP